MPNKNIDDFFDDEFLEEMIELAAGAIYYRLEESKSGETFYLATKKDKEHLNGICNLFEKEYNKKVSYSFKKNICYFSYVKSSKE